MAATRPPPRRGRGFRPSTEHKKRRFGAPHPSAAPPFPSAWSLMQHKPRTMDQGRSSACAGHGTSVLLVVACAAAGTPMAFVPSPRGLYANTRSEEQPGDGPLADTGVSPADMMTALLREGVRPIEAPTPDGRYSDIWTAEDLGGVPGAPPPNVGLRSTLAEDELSSRELVMGPEELQPWAADFEEQVAASIAIFGCGVGVGIHATPAFERWGDAHGPSNAALDDVTGAAEGDGHFVAVLAYRTEPDGQLSFWLANSWGRWGDEHGGVWVTGRWLRAMCLEAWRFKVTGIGPHLSARPPAYHPGAPASGAGEGV